MQAEFKEERRRRCDNSDYKADIEEDELDESQGLEKLHIPDESASQNNRKEAMVSLL